MANIFARRVGTDLPRLEVTVSGDNSAVDLTDATGINFIMKQRYTGGGAFIATGGFASRTSGIVYLDINTATGAGKLNSVGTYLFYINTLFSGGQIRSYPDGYLNLYLFSGLV